MNRALLTDDGVGAVGNAENKSSIPRTVGVRC